MSEEQRYRRQIFLDLVEGDNVDHSRVDLKPADGAVVLIRVGQERVSFDLEQLRLDGLKASATVIVPAGTFVAMSVELGAFGLGSLQLLGIVERSRPSLTVRFEGNDLVMRERLTATVAALADKLAASVAPVERTQIIARDTDQSVDVLELKATVTRLMFEKEELRRDLQDFRTEALAMMRLLRREIEARHGHAPPAPPAPAARQAPEVSAVVRAAFNDDAADAPDAPDAPDVANAPDAANAADAPDHIHAEAASASAPTSTATTSTTPPTAATTTTTTSSAQLFASTTNPRRARPPVLLGPQLIDEFLSEAEAAWSAVVESSPPTTVAQLVDDGVRFDLSDL